MSEAHQTDMNDTSSDATDNDEGEVEESDAAQLANDQREADAGKIAAKFGRQAATGKDALPKFGLYLTRISRDGVGAENKNFKNVMYDIYLKNFNKKLIHSQDKGSRAAQVAKLNTFIKLGRATKFNGEEFMNRAVELYQELKASETKVLDAYPAYTKAARLGVDTDADKSATAAPDDDAVKAVMLPPERKQKTVFDVIEEIASQLETLMTGERKDGNTCQDQEIIDAHGLLQKWLANFTLSIEIAALNEKLAAAGRSMTLH